MSIIIEDLYPVIILKYNIKYITTDFLETYNLISDSLKNIEPIEKKYYLIHDLINIDINNIIDLKKFIKPILEKANYVSNRVILSCIILPKNTSRFIKLIIPICLSFAPVKSYVFYDIDDAITFCEKNFS